MRREINRGERLHEHIFFPPKKMPVTKNLQSEIDPIIVLLDFAQSNGADCGQFSLENFYI